MIEYFKFIKVPEEYSSLLGKVTSWNEMGLTKPLDYGILRWWHDRGIEVKELTKKEYEKIKLAEALE